MTAYAILPITPKTTRYGGASTGAR